MKTILGVIMFMFFLSGTALIIISNDDYDTKHEIKKLDLPEEFIYMSKGDTMMFIESDKGVYLGFYRGEKYGHFKLLIIQ